MTDQYYHMDELSFDEVVRFVSNKQRYHDRKSYILQVDHTRLNTFAEYGCECIACGRVGTVFSVECHCADMSFLKWYYNTLDNPPPTAHINLYGYDQNGSKFMMTSDHVVPRSLKGSNGIKNRRPLCMRCNQLKGNDINWLDDLPKRNGKLIRRPEKQVEKHKLDEVMYA